MGAAQELGGRRGCSCWRVLLLLLLPGALCSALELDGSDMISLRRDWDQQSERASALDVSRYNGHQLIPGAAASQAACRARTTS